MNLKIRFKNPVFIAQLFLSIFTPILTYAGLTFQDLTSWQAIGQLLINAINNPYVLGMIVISVWNALNDPTTEGVLDSDQVRKYTEPKKTN